MGNINLEEYFRFLAEFYEENMPFNRVFGIEIDELIPVPSSVLRGKTSDCRFKSRLGVFSELVA